jgi:hypothetical protein
LILEAERPRHDPAEHVVWEDGPLADAEVAFDDPAPADLAVEVTLEAEAGLADRLWAARETAEAAKAREGRTRAALYQALSLAYDFSLAARDNPQDYAELLEDSGMKAQARAPMTPIVKLVFGVDYDKARLTEFAAALAFASRQDIEAGGFKPLIEAQAGGLKGLVAAERQARRPATVEDKGEAARAAMRAAPPLALGEIRHVQEFALVLTRIGPDGVPQAVAMIEDATLVERAIRLAAA